MAAHYWTAKQFCPMCDYDLLEHPTDASMEIQADLGTSNGMVKVVLQDNGDFKVFQRYTHNDRWVEVEHVLITEIP